MNGHIRGSLGSQGRRRGWGVDGHRKGHCGRKEGGTAFISQQKTSRCVAHSRIQGSCLAPQAPFWKLLRSVEGDQMGGLIGDLRSREGVGQGMETGLTRVCRTAEGRGRRPTAMRPPECAERAQGRNLPDKSRVLPGPAGRQAPLSRQFIPVLTKVTGFSPINWATAKRLAWSESG